MPTIFIKSHMYLENCIQLSKFNSIKLTIDKLFQDNLLIQTSKDKQILKDEHSSDEIVENTWYSKYKTVHILLL